MTDDTQPDKTLPTDTRPPIDHVLTRIVAIFNNSEDMRIGLTVTVGGSVVTGTLVSGATYFETMNELHSKSGLLPVWQPEVEFYREMIDSDEPFDLSVEVERTTFLHLIDASVYGGNQLVGLRAWRGRLSEVSGWSIGSLRAGPLGSE